MPASRDRLERLEKELAELEEKSNAHDRRVEGGEGQAGRRPRS